MPGAQEGCQAVAPTHRTLTRRKEDRILPFAAWVDLEGVAEGDKSDRQMPDGFAQRWNLKSKINRQNRNRLRDIEQTDGGGRGAGGAERKGEGLSSTDWADGRRGDEVQHRELPMTREQLGTVLVGTDPPSGSL